MVITEPGYTFIHPKYDSLLIRLPAHKWYHADHRFGFWITSATHITNSTAPRSCVEELKMPAKLFIPQFNEQQTNEVQCCWFVLHPRNETTNVVVHLSPCVPDDLDNCYLKYIRLYKGIGVDKTRIYLPKDLDKTRFEMVTNAVVIQYYGWVSKSEIRMEVDF
ncbi:hypothetical protein D915_010093 [Fasciola hepatica]|uniref:CUB domain-containing protein n=1 Tax=Fasciola hepatica TaxID=6192 RepID=A0A4E0R0X8_FASHE|nr:hypothetical protein D915_010093 [Fasciola hepatica]